MKRTDRYLNELLREGTINNYEFTWEDDKGNEVNDIVGNRNTEKLTITFSNGKKLVLSTFCSGIAQNTSLRVS